jgi:Rad3-related DNA helicase
MLKDRAMNEKPMIGLAEAAQRLRLPYQNCHRLLLTGQLRGEKRNGRWYVQLDDVERFAKQGLGRGVRHVR